jgi:hypothetical protein
MSIDQQDDGGCNMKKLLAATGICAAAVAVILFAVLAFAVHASEHSPEPEAQKAAPKIVFQELEHDFGKLGPDETVKHTFKFRNEGKETLLIGDIKTTCGCTGTLLSQNEIPPHGEGFVEVTFHSGRSSGARRKAIFVASNDPAQPSTKLEIAANVIVPVEVRPRALYWVAERNEKSARAIDLIYSPDIKLDIKELDLSSPAFTASYQPMAQADVQGYRINIEYNGTLPIGNFHERLTVITDNEQYPKFDVALRGKVIGPVKVVPDSVALGVIKADTLPTRTLRIFDANKANFAITSVESTSPLIAYELSKDGDSNRYVIKISLTQQPPAGAFSERLSIKTNDPADPLVEVPVFAYVK